MPPKMLTLRHLASCSIVLVACGPASRSRNNGDDVPSVDAPASGGCTPENTPAACSDGIDNDCNGKIDCADPSCSGIGNCPVCGMVEHPTGTPVFLPDGIVGTACTTNAQCSGATPNCVENECHASYISKVHFGGFAQGQKLTQISDILSVCLNIEHEWIRDVEISLQAPSGEVLQLNKFLGRTGGEVYLGEPNDSEGTNATANVGKDYCYKPTATNPPMLLYANNSPPNTMSSYMGHTQLPPGDYQASGAWNGLIGATLNGEWQILVTDLWPIDVGYIHSWTIAFNPNILTDCSGPVIQ